MISKDSVSINFHNLPESLKVFCLAVVIPHEILVRELEFRALEQCFYLKTADREKIERWQFDIACSIIQDSFNVLYYVNNHSVKKFGYEKDEALHPFEDSLRRIDEAYREVLDLYKELF